MKFLPIGRQNFEGIIKENLLYVDKTRQIYELIRQGRLYFLSRPRRFGKSLLVSKFHYLFSGKKDLFRGLYIHEQTDYDWEDYPVLQFNFAAYGFQVEHLKEELSRQINDYAKQYEVQTNAISLSTELFTLIEGISNKKNKPVVLLIDEYDKPLVDFIAKPEKAKRNQKVLKDFFSPLKNLEAKGHIRFLFITGVSKFSKISLFSDLNNLTDLTLHPSSKDLLGITHQELLTYFPDYIEKAVTHFQISQEELLQQVQFWYDGYNFTTGIPLYNPFSILNFFHAMRFANYWFATGTPTFLVNIIRDNAIQPKELEDIQVPETFFEKYSLEDIDIIALLFQTGYLTITSTATKNWRTNYTLGYPNEEVRLSMIYNLVEAFTYKKSSIVGKALLKMESGLEEGKAELFIEQLQILLADISYHLLPRSKRNKKSEFEVWEGYFQTIIYLVTSFMGLQVQSEITKQ